MLENMFFIVSSLLLVLSRLCSVCIIGRLVYMVVL